MAESIRDAFVHARPNAHSREFPDYPIAAYSELDISLSSPPRLVTARIVSQADLRGNILVISLFLLSHF